MGKLVKRTGMVKGITCCILKAVLSILPLEQHGILNGEVSTLLMKCIEEPYFNSVVCPNEIVDCGNRKSTVFYEV